MPSKKLPLLVIFAMGIASGAWATSPSVENVSPGVGQRGTEFHLKLIGAGFTEATEVMLYSPGVTCEALKPTSDNELQIRVKAAADCALGTHAFRVRTTKGISELRTFRVIPFPVITAEEPNENLAESKLIQPNVTI